MPIAIELLMPIANSYRICNIRAYFDDYNSEYCLNKHLFKKRKRCLKIFYLNILFAVQRGVVLVFGNNFAVQCSAVSQIKNTCELQTQNFVSATSLVESNLKKKRLE